MKSKAECASSDCKCDQKQVPAWIKDIMIDLEQEILTSGSFFAKTLLNKIKVKIKE